MLRFALTVVAYVVATLAVQAVSHFGINAGHYASVSFMRPESIASLGILASLIQGAVLAWLYPRVSLPGSPTMQAVTFAWLAGTILVSYIALVEPAKYAVPSVASWMAVEFGAGLVQFTLFGLLLSVIHTRSRVARSAA